MKPHPRIRKTIKWGGAAATLVLAALWLVSRATSFSWTPVGGFGIELAHGCLLLEIPHSYRARDFNSPTLRWQSAYWFKRAMLIPGFAWGSNKQWWMPDWKSDGWWTWVLIPFWLPAAVVVPATIAAWRLDTLARRRARTGHCAKCGYNRSGLPPNAKCPECGTLSP